MTENDDLLTPEAVAEMLHVSPATLPTWRSRGTGPKWIRLGHRTIRYRASDVQEWLASLGSHEQSKDD